MNKITLLAIVMLMTVVSCAPTPTPFRQTAAPPMSTSPQSVTKPTAAIGVTTAPNVNPPTVVAPMPATGQAMRLIPVAIESTEPSGGWKYYTVYLAIENQSNQALPITIDTGKGTVETQEGFTYDAEAVRWDSNAPVMWGAPIPLPPQFRVVGGSDNILGFDNQPRFSFRVAQTAHPLRVKFSKYGTIDLGSTQALSFPTDQPRTSFKNIGDTIEIPGQAKITMKQARLSKYGVFDGLTVDVQFQNLNQGNDTSVNAYCLMFDGMGFIRWNKEETRFSAGPGQLTTTKLGFYLWNPARAYKGDNKLDDATWRAIQANAKLVCSGGFQAIFNLNDVTGVSTAPPTPVPPTETPVKAPATPRVYSFYACAQLCQENGANSTRNFTGGAKIIYARYNFEKFPIGAKYTRRWTMNGNEWVRYNCAWQGPESGIDTLKLTEPDGLRSGTWEISITLNDITIFRETITVDGNWNYWSPAGTFNSCYGIR